MCARGNLYALSFFPDQTEAILRNSSAFFVLLLLLFCFLVCQELLKLNQFEVSSEACDPFS